MIRFQTLSFLSIVFIGLAACKKEEQSPTPKLRQRVFTNGKEIEDEAVKNRFIQKSGTPFNELAASSDDIIKFIKPDTVSFNLSGTSPFSVVRNNSQYLFYSPLTLRVTAEYSASPLWLMLKHVSPLFPILGSGGTFEYITREVRVGYADRGAVRLSVLHYRFKRTDRGTAHYENSGYLFNEFNEAAIPHILAGDTLAIQESSLMLTIH